MDFVVFVDDILVCFSIPPPRNTANEKHKNPTLSHSFQHTYYTLRGYSEGVRGEGVRGLEERKKRRKGEQKKGKREERIEERGRFYTP